MQRAGNAGAGSSGGEHVWPSGMLRRHAPGIAIALLLAAVLVSPRWWLLWTEPDEGVRTQVNPGGAYGVGHDEPLYVPGMREAMEGRLPITDPYLIDNQDAPPQTFAWWQEMIGVLAHVTGGNLFYAFAIVATVAAAATFLLFYALALRITRSRAGAIAVILIAVMYVQIFEQSLNYLTLRYWSVLEPILKLDPPGQFHVWYRFLAPSIPLPVFFGAVLLLWQAHEQRRWPWAFAASGALALSIYTNPIYWTALALALVIWAAWLLCARDRAGVLLLAKIGALALALASPELVLLAWNAVELPFEVKSRSGLDDPGLNTDLAVTIAQRIIVGLPFAYFALRGPSWNRFWIALYVAPLVLAVPKGHVPQEDHYLYQAWPPFSLPLFAAGAVEFVRSLDPRYARAVTAGVGAVAIAGAAHFVAFQARAIDSLDQDYALRDDEAAAMAWLRDNASEDETVVTPSRSTNWYIASLTPAYVYVPYGSSAVGSKASDDEIIDRYLRASAAFGYTAEATIERLDPASGIPRPERDNLPRAEIEPYVERSMVDYLLNEYVAQPEKVLARMDEWSAAYARLAGEESVLGAYPADYIYCGPRERLYPSRGAAPGTMVQEAFRQGEVTIYRVEEGGGSDVVDFAGCAAPQPTSN